MGRPQRHVYRVEPPRLPPDFPKRLERLRGEAGLSRRALARALRVDARTLRRWRNGTSPGPGHLYRLFAFAAGRGLLHCLLPAPVASSDHEDGGGGPPGGARVAKAVQGREERMRALLTAIEADGSRQPA
ncbi:MAG: helix-turn-helix transcriptional regulator [Chloroflexi bacterium]|nr:helix-turn-helix transcriptional regulator [Chloroflexota bacterium]